MRLLTGKGTPRGLQDLATAYFIAVIALMKYLNGYSSTETAAACVSQPVARYLHSRKLFRKNVTFCHGLLERTGTTAFSS